MSGERSNAAFAWLSDAIADPTNELSFGAFGAIGLFRPDGEPPRLSSDERGIVADMSATSLRVERRTNFHPVAFEILSSDPTRWNHGIALCLPAAEAMSCERSVITNLGADRDAIRVQDRSRDLVDLGLAVRFADICIRTAGSRCEGLVSGQRLTPVDACDLVARDDLECIFLTGLGRLETRDPGRRFIDPRLIGSGRTHAATTPIPPGFVPCGYVFPFNPARTKIELPFDVGAHRRFQILFARFGPPELVALKKFVEAELARGTGPGSFEPPPDRHSLASLRVTLRQHRRMFPERDISDWLARFDRPALRSQGSPA